MMTVTKIETTTLPIMTEHQRYILTDLDKMIVSYQKMKNILQVVMDDPTSRNAKIQRLGFTKRVRRHISRKSTKILVAGMLASFCICVTTMALLVPLSPSSSSSQECNLFSLECSNDENDTNYCFFGNNYDYDDMTIHSTPSRIGHWFSDSKYFDNDGVDESSFGMTAPTTSSVERILCVILTAATLIYLCLAYQLQHSLMVFCLTRCQEKIRRFQKFCRHYQHHLL